MPPVVALKFVRPAADGPGHAELSGLLLRELDDDRVDGDLEPRDVDLLDHREHVLTDPLGCADHERVRAGVGPDRDGPRRGGTGLRAGRGFGAAAAAARSARGAELRLQLGREILRVGVLEINDLRVAALRGRRVEVGDQRAVLEPRRARAAQQHAVRPVVRDDLHRRRAAAGLRGLIQGAQHPHDLVGRGVLEPDHLDLRRAGFVHPVDQSQHAPDVLRPIRDDQRVRPRMGGQVRGLRQQRPQDRHELRGVDVLEHDRLRHVIVAFAETRVRVRHDLDRGSRVERDEAVHVERRLEQLVESVGRHRGVRKDRDHRAHARVDDDRPADHLLDLIRDHADVRVAVVRRELRPLRSRRLRLSVRRVVAGQDRGAEQGREDGKTCRG